MVSEQDKFSSVSYTQGFLKWIFQKRSLYCLIRREAQQAKILLQCQRAQGAITTSLLRQNDVATSFWRNDEVIIASCVRWVIKFHVSLKANI